MKVDIIIKKNNYQEIVDLADGLLEQGKKKIILGMNGSLSPKFKNITPYLYSVLDNEDRAEIWLKNFPYCVVNEYSRDHILPKDRFNQGKKTAACRQCKLYKLCPGFPYGYLKKYGKEEISPISDLPVELMLELESRCNFKCEFCFNLISFAGRGRNIKPLSTAYWKKVIREAARCGIGTIRFTGGEPLLRQDIFELMRFTKGKGLEVRLNTNASLVNKNNINRFKGILDNVLIPIESYSSIKEAEITGFAGALEAKLNAIWLFGKINTPVIRVGTVISNEVIENFLEFAKLISSLPINEWEFYRPIIFSEKQKGFENLDYNKLADLIIEYRQKTKKEILIANALPFCIIQEPSKLNLISAGALYDDGHSRLVVNPKGFVKPHYYLEKNIGDPLDILSAWKHPFMKKIRNLVFLPAECQDCRFKYKCRGGSLFHSLANSTCKELI